MAVGNEAKEKLMNKIIAALGDSYIGMYDKKYYFNSIEDGVPKQVAISLTCPKNPVGAAVSPTSNEIDFTAEPEKPVMEITPDEQAMIDKLKAELGL